MYHPADPVRKDDLLTQRDASIRVWKRCVAKRHLRALAYIATYAHHHLRVSSAKASTLACTIRRGNNTYAVTATAVVRVQGPQVVTHQGSKWRGPVCLSRHLGFTPSWIYHQPRYCTMRKSIKRRGCPPPPPARVDVWRAQKSSLVPSRVCGAARGGVRGGVLCNGVHGRGRGAGPTTRSAVLLRILLGAETVAMDVDAVVALMSVVYCRQDGYLIRRDSCFRHDSRSSVAEYICD